MGEKMLDVRDLVVNYGAIRALKGISFNVQKGEIISLIGSNGAGKTTTLHSISNLIKKQRGSVIFNNEDVNIEELMPNIINMNKKTFCKLCKSLKTPIITYCNNVLGMNLE